MICGYLGHQTQTKAELLVSIASILSPSIPSTPGSVLSRLVVPVLALLRTCQPSSVASIWANLRGLRITWSTADSRQKQLDEQHKMAAALAAAQAALQQQQQDQQAASEAHGALVDDLLDEQNKMAAALAAAQAALQKQQEDQQAASRAHHAQEDELSRLARSSSIWLNLFKNQGSYMGLSDTYMDKLKQDLAAAEHHIAREAELMRSSQERLAAAARREADLTRDLAAAAARETALEERCAGKNRCLRTCEAFVEHLQGRLAESQQETLDVQQELTTMMQPLQEAHDWAHRVHTEAVCTPPTAVCFHSGLC